MQEGNHQYLTRGTAELLDNELLPSAWSDIGCVEHGDEEDEVILGGRTAKLLSETEHYIDLYKYRITKYIFNY
ncbi:hypothetical protein M0804_002590 [Polistes exclamans]|nr:hypothetical protein M0804_002590 [Polistes exclamans]